MRPTAWTHLLCLDDPEQLLNSFARELGFGAPVAADARTRRTLGVPDDLASIRLAEGPGTTRLMLVSGRPDLSGRDQVGRLAGGLSRKAPHLLWVLVLVVPARFELVLATWQAGSDPARVAAMFMDRRGVVSSDEDRLAALAASVAGSDLEIHAQWMELLGREAISRRFFITLQRLVGRLADEATGNAPASARREIALLYLSRLLFLAFLEARGWLDSDQRFLARTFDDCMAQGGRYQRRVLEPLFFGTLNTPPQRRASVAKALGRIPFLNGGLFSRSPAERMGGGLVLRDNDFGEAFDQLLVRYRFTAREETSTWQESAIDPEILGRAFESLMASPERRATGAFYTPMTIVTRVADSALDAALVARGAPRGFLEAAVTGGVR